MAIWERTEMGVIEVLTDLSELGIIDDLKPVTEPNTDDKKVRKHKGKPKPRERKVDSNRQQHKNEHMAQYKASENR